MSVKLLCNTTDIYERRVLAASLDMFEIWVNDELVLWPIDRGDDFVKKRNDLYKTLYNMRKLGQELQLETFK